MLVFRYEMPDGGGPFFTLDGVQRRTGMKLSHSNLVYGCKRIKDLALYFHNIADIPSECRIVGRNIPDDQVIVFGLQVAFPKEIILKGLNQVIQNGEDI